MHFGEHAGVGDDDDGHGFRDDDSFDFDEGDEGDEGLTADDLLNEILHRSYEVVSH
jgi:hypothetical protein